MRPADARKHPATSGGSGPTGGAVGSATPADAVLDAGDRRCVALLLQLRRLTQELPDGAMVHIIATDPAAPVDLPAWCHLTGHEYLGTVLAPGPRPTYAIRVRAAARTTDPTHPWRLA